MVCEHTCTSHSCTQWGCSALVTTAGCSPPSLSPAHFTAPPWAGRASPAVQGACGQHPVGLPVSCPPPARPCCCLRAQWPRVHTEGTARLGKAERSIPAVPPSICCRGSHRLPTDLKEMNCKQYLGKSKSCWLSHVAEQLPAEV